MYGHALAAVTAAMGIGQMNIETDPLSLIMDLPPIAAVSGNTKLSVGDKAHRAFNKTRLYKPNGAREVARRLRQSATA